MTAPTLPLEVRCNLIDTLQIDLIGPTGPLGNHNEILPQTPSRWYLTGFLVPTEADETQRCDPTSNDELDQAAEPAGLDDDDSPEKPAARRSYLPSSMVASAWTLKTTNAGRVPLTVYCLCFRHLESPKNCQKPKGVGQYVVQPRLVA